MEKDKSEYETLLGEINDNNLINDNIDYYITPKEVSSHLACLGVTGSGKSTTVSTILTQLTQNIKILVLDFHNTRRSQTNIKYTQFKPRTDRLYKENRG